MKPILSQEFIETRFTVLFKYWVTQIPEDKNLPEPLLASLFEMALADGSN